jgi:thiol:disulfide interchange protein DsbD
VLETINEWGFALSQTLQAQLQAGSVGAIFVVFAAGVLTSLTPCVYPMIPVTVTYIGAPPAAIAGVPSRFR